MTDQLSLDASSEAGLWRVIATRVTNDTPLAEKQFWVVTPAAISLVHQLPPTVTLDQTFTATTTIINSGGAAVDDSYSAPLSALIGNSGTADYVAGPIPATLDIAGSGQVSFTWQYKATGIGSFTVEGSGYGYDLNNSDFLTAATQSSNMCMVQSKPVLSVVSLTKNYTDVYRNQTGLMVPMLIRNQGQAAVYVDSASLSFSNGTHYQTVISPSEDPFLLAGNSDVIATFSVSVDENSATGAVNASGSFTAYEVNNPAATYTVNGAVTALWNILSAVGYCAANSEFNPEQYTFNQGQTVYVKFTGMAPAGGNAYQIWVYDANNVKQTSPIQSGIGVSNHSFTLPAGAALGKWRAEIHIVKSPGGVNISTEGVQFFDVQAQGNLVPTLTISPSVLELGNNITLTMLLTNTVANSSTIYPATPTLPVRAPAGYTGQAAALVSGPEPASASVSYGNPATFTWVFTTTAFTDIGSSFAMVATASGIDLNTTHAETPRIVTSASDTSNAITILYRGIEFDPDPLELGVLLPGQNLDFAAQLKNTGNTHFKSVIWQKAYPTSPTGNKIPYAYFDLTPASGFTVATGTAVTPCSFGITMPYNQPPGTYTALMAVYDDLSSNGARDLGEPYYEFSVEVVASSCKVVYAGEDQVELGGYPVGAETATVTLNIFNGGNLNLEKLRFKQTDANFSLSTIWVEPDPFGALATDAVGIASISALIGNDSGECIATWTVWEDTNENYQPDSGEAYDQFTIRFTVGAKSFTVTDPGDGDNIRYLGNATPTLTLHDFPVRINNTGDIDIINPEIEVADLIQGSYTIPKEYISIEMPDGPIAPGTYKIATITELYIPAGTAVGLFSGVQSVFDDENADGINNGTANEVTNTFVIELTVNPYYSVQVIPSTVDLGGIAPGEPEKSVGFLCRNAGNMALNDLGWFEINLLAGGFQITTDKYYFTPGPAVFSAAPAQTFNATISMQLLSTQEPGLYSGNFGRLFNNPLIVDASDSFIITCQVGSKAIDIIEAGPLVATGTPNAISTSASYRIQNTGSLVLAKPRVKAVEDLKDGVKTIPALSCVFSPSTFDYLSPGQTKAGEFAVQIPPGQLVGTYVGDIRVWDDTNDNFVADPSEASATVSVEVRVIGQKLLTIAQNPADLFFIPAGQSGSMDLTLTNNGNQPINGSNEIIRIQKYALNPVAPGPPSISDTAVSFVSLPAGLTVGESATVTVSVTVPPGQTAGPYEGYQLFYIEIDGAPTTVGSCNLLLKLTVGEKKLSVTSTVDMGSGNPSIPGTPTVLSRTFVIDNLTSIPLSKLKWAKVPLESSGNFLPVSAFEFSPSGPFNVSSNGSKVTTASLTIPMHQPAGSYSALQTVFEDEDGDGNPDPNEASDTFTLTVAVNSFERIQILPSIADLGTIDPGETSVAYDIDVFNVGNVAISGLDGLWNKADLTGAGTLDSSLVNFTSITDPLNPGITSTIQVTVGPLLSTQAAGAYSGIQTLKGQTCELQLQVNSAATAPDLASGTIYQEIATTTFSNVAPETLIFSAYVAATGSVGLGFLETLPDQSTSSYNGIVFDFATRNLTKTGAAIIDYSAVPVEVQGNLTWYRLYMTFNYQFVESAASHTYIILKNATPDAAVAVASYSAWFDGIQLEKAVIPGQTRPTAYGAKGKLISPSDEISIDGKTQHYEW